MRFEQYATLPAQAERIRTEVFVEEQGFSNEFDEIDGSAIHLICYDDEIPIATCRIFYKDEMQSYVVGRIAVIRARRGEGIGAALLAGAEDYIRQKGGQSVMLLAQLRASGFYEKSGYKKQGEICMDEGCAHIWMRKELK